MLFCTMTAFAQDTLITYGSAWKYYDAGNAPPNNIITSWEKENYNDADWSSGPAQLGYGDGDEATVVSSDARTVYFRHSFDIADASAYANLILGFLYDDGLALYLNGTAIGRVNMPPVPLLTYSTFAASNSSDNARVEGYIPSELLKNGTNVIAVEVHQNDATSTDISFDFQMVALPEGFVRVLRGPYLQKGASTSMTVRWRTDTPVYSGIRYGTDINNLDLARSSNAETTEHEIELSNLAPSTVYYYEIFNDENTLVSATEDLYFKTSPLPGTDVPISAWILGDCGTGNANQRAVRDAFYNHIGDEHTDMMLFLGDNAYNSGTDNEYQYSIFQNMYEDKLKNTVSWSCLGNHDGYTADSETQEGNYYQIFSLPKNAEAGGLASGTEAYYSFDYGNIHFIVLDSYDSDRSTGGAMHTWCENDIQNTTSDWIVAIWHHPPYTKGSHNSDAEADLIEMRQNFLPMLESNGVDLVLNGHSHSYERSHFINGHYGYSSTFDPATHVIQAGSGKEDQDGHYQRYTVGNQTNDGAVYIVTGSAGKIDNAALNHNAMYYSAASLGSTLMNVHGDTMRIKFLRETGVIDDYFTIIKDDNCIAGTPCNDDDPCTANDVYDDTCNCAGTGPNAAVDAGENLTTCTGQVVLSATLSMPDDDLSYRWVVYDNANAPVNVFTGNNVPVTITGNGYIELTVSNASGCPLGTDQVNYNIEGDDDNDNICNSEDPCDNSTDGNVCSDNNLYTVNDALQNCQCVGCYQIDLKVKLEGAYDIANQLMNNGLYQINLLPGQADTLAVGTPTPPGQPYNIAPWFYEGMEGTDWTSVDYTADIIDWVLVSFRTGIEKNTEVAQTAGVLYNDGSISFPDRCALNSTHPASLYIVIEHRNHIGVMSPQPVNINNGVFRYNFSLVDSYRDATSFGQKQLADGTWAMFAGDIDQSDLPSYDINSNDKSIWFDNNGIFKNYLPADMNLDGDINGEDKALWENNNGVSSRVQRQD